MCRTSNFTRGAFEAAGYTTFAPAWPYLEGKPEDLRANPDKRLGTLTFKQIVDKEMPYDVAYEGDTRYENVSEAELKALETWIQQLGTKSAAACGERKFVSHEDMIVLKELIESGKLTPVIDRIYPLKGKSSSP